MAPGRDGQHGAIGERYCPHVYKREGTVPANDLLPIAAVCHSQPGKALNVFVDSPTYKTQKYAAVPYLDLSAAYDNATLILNVVNRHRDQPIEVEVQSQKGSFGGTLEVAEVNGPTSRPRIPLVRRKSLLASGFRPTAIVCVNDFMDLGVLRELRDQGLRVFEDVSVTGFDNIKLSEFSYPRLTTVHIPRERIGHFVFQRLVPDPTGRPVDRDILLDPELVLRESAGPMQDTHPPAGNRIVTLPSPRG